MGPMKTPLEADAVKKVAKAAYAREYRKKNPEKAKAAHDKWARSNRAHLKEYHEGWRERNLEHVRAGSREATKRYYSSDRGKAKLESTKDARAAYSREYFKKNREKHNAASRRWGKAHPEAKNAYQKKYAARLRGEVLNAYGHQCVCCGETERAFLTIDHIVPRAQKKVAGEPRCGSALFYAWIRKLGFPKDGYRILCYNCNCGRNQGPCPHEVQRSRAQMRNVNEVHCQVGY
jgi:hypothetical protein